MFKAMTLVPQSTPMARDLSPEALLGSRELRPKVVRAVRNLVTQDLGNQGGEGPRLAAVDEIWFHNSDDANAFVTSGPDGRWRLPIVEHSLIESDEPDAALKLVALAYPATGMSRAESQQHWRDRHFPLSRQLGLDIHFMRFAQNWIPADWTPDDPRKAFIGAAMIWFKTHDEMAAAWSDPEKVALIQEDERRFFDTETAVRVFVEEHAVV